LKTEEELGPLSGSLRLQRFDNATNIAVRPKRRRSELGGKNAMKEYEKANRQTNFGSTIIDVMSDKSNSASDRLADGMILAYIDEIMSGNAQ
jgi:hypothetical protein